MTNTPDGLGSIFAHDETKDTDMSSFSRKKRLLITAILRMCVILAFVETTLTVSLAHDSGISRTREATFI